MKKLISKYKNPNVERFNFKLMDREYDIPITTCIENTCKSLEAVGYIEYEGCVINDDTAQIERSKYIIKRNQSKKEKNLKYRDVDDTRAIEMILKFKIFCKGKTVYERKSILVPIPDDDGYYLINGTRYFLMYQMVDSSTYNTSDCVNLKSMSAISIKSEGVSYKSREGIVYKAPIYKIRVGQKFIDIFAFFFASKGIKNTLSFFSINNIVSFTSDDSNPENIYFTITRSLFIAVNREFFENHLYVKSMVFMILELTTNRYTLELMLSKEFWIEKLGAVTVTKKYNHYEKGQITLQRFKRLLDETTKHTLRINKEHKKDIYTIVRWMVQNYSELRKKDNLDLDNKRLRCNEYIAYLLSKAFGERVNRVMSGAVTMDKLKEIFKFPGDIIIKHLHGSGLLRFDDHVNDMDMFSKLKYTIKGPSSMGQKNDNKISIAYRSTPPSYIGKIDINVCGNSDPGTSGVLTPFVETDGLYFSDKTEPERFRFDFTKSLNEMLVKKDHCVISFNTIDDYYKSIQLSEDDMSRISLTRNSDKFLVVHIPDEIDED